MANLQSVVNYFLYLDESADGEDGITNLKLQKLAYYAQGFHLALYGRPLFDNSIEAWTHGPVVPELYHQYKGYGSAPISGHGDFSDLDGNETELLNEVFEVFGQFSAWKLRNMTHEEKPWLDHEKAADVISHDELAEYFKTRLV